jgi:hypothetical protein
MVTRIGDAHSAGSGAYRKLCVSAKNTLASIDVTNALNHMGLQPFNAARLNNGVGRGLTV